MGAWGAWRLALESTPTESPALNSPAPPPLTPIEYSNIADKKTIRGFMGHSVMGKK